MKITVFVVFCISASYAFKGNALITGIELSEVQILYKNKPLCTGALLSNQAAITTATCLCLTRKHLSDLTVSVETSNMTKAGKPNDVSGYTCHDNFSDTPLFAGTNDVAIILLKDRIKLTKDEVIIKVSDSISKNNENCYIVRWNHLKNSRSLEIISKERCSKMIDSTVQKDHICVLIDNLNLIAEDIGSPLVCNNEVIGLFSWKGPNIANQTKRLYIFTNIAHTRFLQQIKTKFVDFF